MDGGTLINRGREDGIVCFWKGNRERDSQLKKQTNQNPSLFYPQESSSSQIASASIHPFSHTELWAVRLLEPGFFF